MVLKPPRYDDFCLTEFVEAALQRQHGRTPFQEQTAPETVGGILQKIKPEPSAAWGWPGREETPARHLRRPLPRDEKPARHVEPVARIHSRGWSRRQWPCQPCRQAVVRRTVGPIQRSALRCRSI